MARGNRIVLTPDRGHFEQGYIDTAEYPGTIVQMDPTHALVTGRFHWVVFNRDADGDRPMGPYIVLCEDFTQGKGIDPTDSNNAHVAGQLARGFVCYAGAEVNLLFKNVSGTADDVVAGNLFIVDDATGKVIVTTGSPEEEPFMALEALTDPSADALVWSVRCG